MPKLRPVLTYLTQAMVLGLAVAFVMVLIWPEFLQREASAPMGAMTVSDDAAPALLPSSGPVSYAAAVERAAPAVVNINTAKIVSVRSHPFFDDPVFRQFLERGRSDMVRPQQRVERSLGSGVIMSTDGVILTNHHVIHGADEIQVSLRDGRIVGAEVIGSDPESDIAVLKIDLANLPIIAVGESDKIHVGDVVLAIGNPFGVGQTVTSGIVSATGRNRLGINTFENFIQTDAAINPGNSGGALIDAYGRLVGINTAIFSKSGGSQGIGFAIPASLARNVMNDILTHGRPQRGWLGVEARAMTVRQARESGLKDPQGIVVAGVYRDGPAHKAGLQPGDVILEIDGKSIHEAREALFLLSRRKPGSKIKLSILREGKRLQLVATAIERPLEPQG